MTETSLVDRAERNLAASSRLGLPQAVAAALLVAVVVAVVVTWWVGLIAGVIVGAALAVVLPRRGTSSLDAVFGAETAAEVDYPRFHNLMDGLSISSGIAAPQLRVVTDPGLNLAVFGPADDGVVVATSGLLEHLDRIELEGVLAEALVRLRSNDALLGAKCAALVCGPLVRCGPHRDATSLTVASLLAGSRAKRLRSTLGEQRALLGDLGAVDLTRYPPGLGSALAKMESLGSGVRSATWGTAHLWLADPLVAPAADAADADRRTQLNELFGQDVALGQRVALMCEL